MKPQYLYIKITLYYMMIIDKIISITFVLLFISPSLSAFNPFFSLNSSNEGDYIEYWAILFAVGVYKNNPDKDRPSMLTAVDNLYDTLISHGWITSHIHKIKGVQATGSRLIQEFLWLYQNTDRDSLVLIYLTTHGSPIYDANGNPLDLPPRDEKDGVDEALIMYDGFENPYAIIWDDLLNLLLSLIRCRGVCVIVDSCFSGGFNDPPYRLNERVPQYSFTQEMIGELGAGSRVVLMSTEEDTVSYGSIFSNYLINGFNGAADENGNRDGINSAEESFYYAKEKVDSLGWQHPTILDLYPAEFPVTIS